MCWSACWKGAGYEGGGLVFALPCFRLLMFSSPAYPCFLVCWSMLRQLFSLFIQPPLFCPLSFFSQLADQSTTAQQMNYTLLIALTHVRTHMHIRPHIYSNVCTLLLSLICSVLRTLQLKLKTLLLKLKKHCHSKHATLAAATQNSKHCYSNSKNTATQNTLHWQLQLKLKTLLLKLKKHCHSKHTTLTDEPPSAAGGG